GLDIKFIVSGSSSMNLAKGAGESLAGRITIHRLTPFSFKEFLSYQGIKPPDISLEDISYPANSSRYRIAFKEYMEKGGLPEMYEEFSLEQLRQTLDLVFFRDIVDIFPVKRTDVLKGIFRLTAENTGQKINYTKLAGDLGTEYRTIRDYVEYLQDSFLLEKSVPYERSGLKAMRKNPKMYVSEHAYTNLWRCKKGLVAQTIAFNYLKRYGEPSYIQEPEVDIVLPEKKWAFEVKYSSAVSKGDAKNLASVPKGFRLFMITENSYDTWDIGGRQVQLVPLWLLCLCK
ncbi:MAG: ATP-binding protein, partial [Candidatus Aenigmarchaeota archaeon]|nr:ATP-binding protein [Candidatus Aenigmarchaeota archaeon]